MDSSTDFDVIVIGAGPAGENVIDRAVRGGLSAAIVEQELAGGECSYWACMPSKALLRPMELAGEVGRVPGLSAGPIDTAAVLARRDKIINGLDDAGQVEWIDGVPATFVRGRGELTGPKQVSVVTPDGETRTLTARRAVVIATGSRAVLPPVPGLAEARPWTNREATTVERVPERLVVIGGGVVACEMAQALHSLGARETTMIVRDDVLLGRVEAYAAGLLADALTEAGISIRFGAQATQVERGPDGPVTVRLSDGSAIEADELLVATGRTPATANIGLENVGLSGKGPIEVDDTLRSTTVDWLYAVGDVNGRNALTHMGKYQARICGDVIAGRPGLATADAVGAPQVIFTDPQICAVGRTEATARADGFNVRVIEVDLATVAGASLLGEGYTGRAKAVVDEDRKVLLGVTFAGPGVAELLHAATIAVVAEVPLDRLWHAIPSYPTVSEVWLRLLEAYGL